ncbi:MAG: HPr(Ser) kinase/phosphatase [Leptonema sp. (in: bacteria)]
MQKIQVKDLLTLTDLHLEVIAGIEGLEREITKMDINRPGLALIGFYENFAADRIQVIGKGEYSFIDKCEINKQKGIINSFLSFPIPAVIFTHNQFPPECFIEEANKNQIPVLVSKCSTHDFQMKFYSFISEILAEEITVPGVLLDIFGVGVLLQGESGIGKSETALELIERGHRLIADDVVRIKAISESVIMGYTDPTIEYHMELRGIGIINIKEMYGVRSTRKKINVEICIYLEEWKKEVEYDRLGVLEEYSYFLNVKIPKITLPVRPGRNIPILIETAAMNYRLKTMGYDTSKTFIEKVKKNIEKKTSYISNQQNYAN